MSKHFKTIIASFMMLIHLPGYLNADINIPASVLYQQYCSVCHGENGDGNTHARQGLHPPPRDFTQLSRDQLDTKLMIHVISEGRSETAMAAWKNKLSKRQITAIAEYIRSNFMSDPKQKHIQKYAVSDEHPGKTIYAETCSVCHGDNGQGAVWGKDSLNPPPRDFTTQYAQQQLSEQRMLASVSQGRPGTAMSAYSSRLSKQEIEDVVNYIREEFMQVKDHNEASMSDGLSVNKLKLTNTALVSLSGNLDNGKALYLQNCTACHGVNGDGNGPRAYFIFPKPRNFLEPVTRARFDRGSLFKAIKNGVRGKEMPAWGKVLSGQQMMDITEYVLQTFINPESGSISLKND